ncbi:predicted protein [Nematostella vectensis]|uniref:Glycosyl hydrolase family 13 catalytic domain-containing protein n=1 Tax=Nematostella vectensis TaxID=45351 RepID=A7SGS7_NEMVE|nr:predicted protein [Nematostella vectensis]|eukprot:XP_001629097.1 predicted protein [Nematostella vectensis]
MAGVFAGSLDAFRSEQRWWKNSVIYHIYPRSFQDSNGDGNGDLSGIRSRLDYLDYLGVKIIYLSPIFKSPMVDNGYDVSDFMDVNPMFGTMEDFESLLQDIHSRGMKLLLDFVPNHTSDQHDWFLESRSNRHNPRREWYIWRDAASDGTPPNNWLSVFGGSAWSLDRKTNQYYLHQFFKEQPDLNFRNPDVVNATKEVLGFWLDKGVDGFRVDAVPHLLEDEEFRDEPVLASYDTSHPQYKDLDHQFTCNLDDVHGIVRGWRQFCSMYRNPYRLLIGEILCGNETAMSYYGHHKPEFNFPLNFSLIGLKKGITALEISEKVVKYLNDVPKGKWPNWLLGNHDCKRVGTRMGQANLPAMTVLYLTLPGTAVMYYGDEIGLMDADISKGEINDSRDPCRGIMQWENAENYGFSQAKKLWLPGTDNNKTNVEVQKLDETSMLVLTRKILKLRNAEKAFHGLNFRLIHVDSSILAYTRSTWLSKYVVIINFGSRIWSGGLERGLKKKGVVIIDSSTIMAEGTELDMNRISIHPGHALVVKIK